MDIVFSLKRGPPGATTRHATTSLKWPGSVVEMGKWWPTSTVWGSEWGIPSLVNEKPLSFYVECVEKRLTFLMSWAPEGNTFDHDVTMHMYEPEDREDFDITITFKVSTEDVSVVGELPLGCQPGCSQVRDPVPKQHPSHAKGGATQPLDVVGVRVPSLGQVLRPRRGRPSFLHQVGDRARDARCQMPPDVAVVQAPP